MADEQIDELVIDIQIKHAKEAVKDLDDVDRKLDKLNNSIEQGGEISKFAVKIKEVAAESSSVIEQLSGKWDYLNNHAKIYESQINRVSATMEKLKKKASETSDEESQSKIAAQLEKLALTYDRLTIKRDKAFAAENADEPLQQMIMTVEELEQKFTFLSDPMERLKHNVSEAEAAVERLGAAYAGAQDASEKASIGKQLTKAYDQLEKEKQKLDEHTKSLEQQKMTVEELGAYFERISNPIGMLDEKISRLAAQIERYKQALANAGGIEEQERLKKKIEETTEKMKKLNAEREKATKEQSQPPDEEPSDGLSDVSSIAGLFGKTGSQISSIVGKISTVVNLIKTLGATIVNIAAPIAIVVAGVTAVKGIVNQIKNTGQFLLNLAKKIGQAIVNNIKNKLESLIAPIQQLRKNIGRVVFNRLIREGFNLVQNSIAEGIKNVAQGVDKANAILSQYSTQIMYLKNTLASALIPVLNALYPAFEFVTNAIIRAINAINQFLSALSGKSTYIKAQRQYVDYANSITSSSKKAKDSVQRLTASFDELHDITETSTSGADEDDYSQYFTMAGIEANVDGFYKRLREAFANGDLSDIGVSLADKLNSQLQKMISLIKWENVSNKITKKITAVTTGLRSFLKTFVMNGGFENLGTTIGSALDTVIQSLVTFDRQMQEELITINDTVLNGFGAIGVGIADTLYGMVMAIDWEALGEFLIDKLTNLFDVAKGLTARMLETVVYNGKTMTRVEAMVTKVMTGLAAALDEAIKDDKFTSIGETVGNMLITIFKAGAAIFTSSNFWQNLAVAVNDVISALANKMRDPNFIKSLKDFVITIINGVATLLSSVDLDEIFNAINAIILQITVDPRFQNAVSNLGSALGGIAGRAFSTAALAWVSSIITKINYYASSIKNFFGNNSYAERLSGKKSGKIKAYATGGFPEDGLFFANRRELVGKFSNGKTAVANNEQIIQGIQRGVTNAILATGFNRQGGTTQLTGDVIIDGKKAGRIVAEGVGTELNRRGWTTRATTK